MATVFLRTLVTGRRPLGARYEYALLQETRVRCAIATTSRAGSNCDARDERQRAAGRRSRLFCYGRDVRVAPFGEEARPKLHVHVPVAGLHMGAVNHPADSRPRLLTVGWSGTPIRPDVRGSIVAPLGIATHIIKVVARVAALVRPFAL